MTDLAERIARFEHMAQADPLNDMAHFSLGSAYLQADRFAEAAASLRRCVELNPDMSKAWQLAGEALVKAGSTDEAAKVLTEGYEVAASKGDRLPQEAMAGLLRSIGAEVPTLSAEAEERAQEIAASGAFVCRRSGRPGNKLEGPPFRGPVGAWIHEHITAETWREWIGQGTKVINELRLDLSRDQDAEVYDQHMREYLGIDDAVLAEIEAAAEA